MTRKPKVYTLQEANQMIPKLRELFPQLRRLRDRVIRERDQCDVEEITSHGLQGALAHQARDKMDKHRALIRSLETDMDKQLKLFDGLDCQLKGLDPGLVDFYGQRKGHLVYFCWKEDESRIAYWHSLSGGYAGRQPLP